jgi:hypothetical protein
MAQNITASFIGDVFLKELHGYATSSHIILETSHSTLPAPQILRQAANN